MSMMGNVWFQWWVGFFVVCAMVTWTAPWRLPGLTSMVFSASLVPLLGELAAGVRFKSVF